MAAITPAWVKTHYEGNGTRRVEASFASVSNGDTWAHGIVDGKIAAIATHPDSGMSSAVSSGGTLTISVTSGGNPNRVHIWGSL